MKAAGFALFDTALGPCGVAWNARGLCAAQLPEPDAAALRARLRRRVPGAPEVAPPAWVQQLTAGIAALLRGETVWVNGDGATSRDFCYVANVVQANLRAALVDALPSGHEVFNVAYGARTTLLELVRAMHAGLSRHAGRPLALSVAHREFRAGDVRHSLADVSKARSQLGYAPTHDLAAGLDETTAWYAARLDAGDTRAG